jgi:hypothetical protein
LSPGGATVAHLPAATPLGAPTWLWVLRTTTNGRWGRVVLPLKPNGRTGWINLHGLRTVHTSTWIRASLHDRRIWLMHGSRPLASFPAAIGAVTTPPPSAASASPTASPPVTRLARSAGTPSACQVTSRTCLRTGRAATSWRSTAPTIRRRSAPPPRTAVSASRPKRSRAFVPPCAWERRS